MKQLLLFLSFNLLSFSVYSQTVDSLIVGSGGGVSGQTTMYKIIKHTVYKGKGMPEVRYNESAKTKAKKLSEIYKRSEKLFHENNGFDRPSNVYYFIELYYQGKKVKFAWGDPSFETPREVKELYDQTRALIKELKFQ